MMGQVHVTNPRYALVVSGGCCAPKAKKFIIGNWAYVCSCVTDVQKISLELMTLLPTCEDVETSLGVPLSVTAVAQVKVMKEKEFLKIACEQFLGYEIQEIKFAVCSTLEGHLRAILGTLTVEEVYKDREKFAALVLEVAAPDVGRMGIEIISFTIKDISDKVGYLDALGKTQTAMVKRDAAIGVAVANRDAGIKEAEAEKEAMDYKYMMDTVTGKHTNAYKIKLSEFEKEMQAARAEVSLAYELQANILNQEIREAEINIDIMKTKKEIEVQQREVKRKELELTGLINLPAEAEAFQIETISEGVKNAKIATATGEAEETKLIGTAEAYRVEKVGEADASGMRLRAKVFKTYTDVAKLSIILSRLPELTAEVSAPLSKIDEILVLGSSDDLLDGFVKVMGKIPPSLRTIAGIDVMKVLQSRLKEHHPEKEAKNDQRTSRELKKHQKADSRSFGIPEVISRI